MGLQISRQSGIVTGGEQEAYQRRVCGLAGFTATQISIADAPGQALLYLWRTRGGQVEVSEAFSRSEGTDEKADWMQTSLPGAQLQPGSQGKSSGSEEAE